uniref:Uncharacterized protein n=1 Tax=Ixodes ricinus TaxID=34613 RepID=A0A6B0UYX8_IXORI
MCVCVCVCVCVFYCLTGIDFFFCVFLTFVMSCLDVRMCAHMCTYCKKKTKKKVERNEKTKKYTRNVFSFFFYTRCFFFVLFLRVGPLFSSKCGILLPPCSHIVNFRRSIHHPLQFFSRLCVPKVCRCRPREFCVCFFVFTRHVHTDTHTCTRCARIHIWARGKEKQIMMKNRNKSLSP